MVRSELGHLVCGLIDALQDPPPATDARGPVRKCRGPCGAEWPLAAFEQVDPQEAVDLPIFQLLADEPLSDITRVILEMLNKVR